MNFELVLLCQKEMYLQTLLIHGLTPDYENEQIRLMINSQIFAFAKRVDDVFYFDFEDVDDYPFFYRFENEHGENIKLLNTSMFDLFQLKTDKMFNKHVTVTFIGHFFYIGEHILIEHVLIHNSIETMTFPLFPGDSKMKIDR